MHAMNQTVVKFGIDEPDITDYSAAQAMPYRLGSFTENADRDVAIAVVP